MIKQQVPSIFDNTKSFTKFSKFKRSKLLTIEAFELAYLIA